MQTSSEGNGNAGNYRRRNRMSFECRNIEKSVQQRSNPSCKEDRTEQWNCGICSECIYGG